MAPDQFAIADFLGRIALGPDNADYAVGRRQLIGRRPQPLRGQFHQRLASGSRRQRQIAVIEVRGVRLASRSDALIRGERRVAIDQASPG